MYGDGGGGGDDDDDDSNGNSNKQQCKKLCGTSVASFTIPNCFIKML